MAVRFSAGCASACCVPDASASVAGLVGCPPRADFRSAQADQAPLLRFLAPSASTGPCCAVRGPPALRTIPLRLSPALNGAPMRFFALGRDKPLRIEGWPVLSGGPMRGWPVLPGGPIAWLSDRRSRRVIQHRFLLRRRTGPIPWSFCTAWSGVYPTALVGFVPFAVFLRAGGVRTFRPIQPACRHFRRPPRGFLFFLEGRLGCSSSLVPNRSGARNPASGLSRDPAVPNRRIGPAAAALGFFLFQVFRPASRDLGQATSLRDPSARELGRLCPALQRLFKTLPCRSRTIFRRPGSATCLRFRTCRGDGPTRVGR